MISIELELVAFFAIRENWRRLTRPFRSRKCRGAKPTSTVFSGAEGLRAQIKCRLNGVKMNRIAKTHAAIFVQTDVTEAYHSKKGSHGTQAALLIHLKQWLSKCLVSISTMTAASLRAVE
jgi:hypothetical protein